MSILLLLFIVCISNFQFIGCVFDLESIKGVSSLQHNLFIAACHSSFTSYTH